MTLTSFEPSVGAAQAAQEFKLRDARGPLLLYGEIISDLSWGYDTAYEKGHVRWTDITLYRNLDVASKIRYAIQIVGRSVVYHSNGSSCRKGVSSPVSHLRRDAERYRNLAACERCNPADLDDMKDTDLVDAEEDIYTLHRCETATDVVRIMQAPGSRGSMSWLNVKLLQAAERGDEDIAAALLQMRRL